MLSEWKMKLARTERITRGTDRQGITGCPEALYQIQLFKQEKYVGRVGFNLHHEKVWRVTIANLQGIPGGCPEYLEFLERHGIGPFNELMQTAKTLFRRFDSNTMILGLRNPSTDNSDLLNTVLEAEEIQRARFRRKD